MMAQGDFKGERALTFWKTGPTKDIETGHRFYRDILPHGFGSGLTETLGNLTRRGGGRDE